MEDSIYLNYNKIRSFNALINLIISERGLGKTYGFKEMAIKHFKKTGKQFIYLRRYDSDLKESVGSSLDNKFFEQVKDKFKDDKFSISKSKKVSKLYINDKICGYAFPLSASESIKSVSFENVDTICFDECMLKDGSTQRYLKNEAEVLLDVIETIGRLRNGIKVYCLGNAISSTNPIMNYFDLTLPYNSEYKTFKDGLILVFYARNSKYREVKKQTEFGRLISDTKYGKYAIDNEFLTDSKTFIKKKSKGVHYYYTIVIDNKKYGIWRNYEEQSMYVSEDIDPNCRVIFAITDNSHNENSILVKSHNPYIKNIKNYYNNGLLYFESQRIKNTFNEYILRYIY